jgi:hypothetical protein
MTERTMVFGTNRSLSGIATDATSGLANDPFPTVIFLNSGLMHRVGPNRLYVRLARRLSQMGLPSLRFDLSGIGDSRPAADRLKIRERWVAECRAAMDAMAVETGARNFVLAGNCSGAAAAFLTARADDRVVGLGLINLQGPRVLRYYLRLVAGSLVSWRRLFHGSAKLPTLRSVGRQTVGSAGSGRSSSSLIRGLDHLAERGVDMLLVNSEWDAGYDYFHGKQRPQLERGAMRERIHLDVLPGANHELSLVANQDRLVDSIVSWAGRMQDARWRSPSVKHPTPVETAAR